MNIKKISRGVLWRHICTKFGAIWKILIYRNDDTTSVTHTKLIESQNHTMTQSPTYKLLVISLFRRSENPRKKFGSIREIT